MSPRVRARRPREVRPPEIVVDPAILEAYLEDASGNPPGRALGLVRPGSEEEASAFLRATAGKGVAVLPQAARSSLTGGAVPAGDVVLSVERLSALGSVAKGGRRATASVEAGLRLKELQRALSERGLYFPPVPTYQEAMIGGAVSTNAGGAATFKYGVTRDWVRGLRVLLFNGDRLEIERGEHVARPSERFQIELTDGRELSVPVPTHRLPPLKKISAGYHSADPLDLVDLFVGAEGTLGLVTGVTLDLVPLPPAVITGLTFVEDRRAAIALAAELRRAALEARATHDHLGPDVRAVEFVDRHGLTLLRDDPTTRRLRITIPPGAGGAILFEVELEELVTEEEAQETVAAYFAGGSPVRDGPLSRLLRLLDQHRALDGLDLAFPQSPSRQEALHEFREAVPRRVNEVLSERRRTDPAVRKVGGDLIVPFEQLAEMMDLYEAGFLRRGLEFAIWGHVSDGNLHPNALPRDEVGMAAAAEALLEFSEAAITRGGAPLSEHGVGRSPLKQEMLRRFLGPRAVAGMRRVKASLDPEWRFAPGVLFRTG